MGATEYYFMIQGHATQAEVDDALRERQADDRARNGHQEGYSGDSQTVEYATLANVGPFTTAQDAMNYIDEHAEKWEFFVAVHTFIDDKKRTLIGGLAAI